MLDISLDYVDGVEELWLAAYNGDVTRLEALLTNVEFKDRINHTINLGYDHSPLFFACYGAGNAEAVRVLLDAGADPFQRDNIGRLPLHYAANSLHKEVIDALLETPNMKTHRLDAISSNGQTPLHALFLPSLGISHSIRADNSKLSECLDSMLDPNRDASKRAMEQLDKRGINSFMLVKHYKLNSWFPSQHTPPKMFENYLRCFVTVPSNLTEILASDSYYSTLPLEAAISIETRLSIFAAAQKNRLAGVMIFTSSDVGQGQDKNNIIDVNNSEFKYSTPVL